ncbi:hypothetical protein CRYUN_Cryun05aG0079300 [Craigia yunnanensis]
MVPNSVALTRRFPHLYRFMSFSSKNLCLSARRTIFPIRGFKGCFHSYFLSSSHGAVFKEWSACKTGAGQLGFDYFRVSAVSDGGSGGIGGFGGSGDGNSSGKGEGADGNGGRSGWSFLSWYLCLSDLVKLPGASGAFLRLLLDQFLFAPIFIGVFLSTLVTLEGRPSQVVPKLQQEWFSAVLANWQLWIPFQFLNFRFVPQQFQVLAANFIALVWNVILSFKAHKEILTK